MIFLLNNEHGVLHRYSKEAHYVFLAYCFFTNFVIFAGLLVDATGAINILVKDLMPEFSSMLLAILIGGFTIIGGLGGTFYVSYINGIFLFVIILVLQVFFFFVRLTGLTYFRIQGHRLSWVFRRGQSDGKRRKRH